MLTKPWHGLTLLDLVISADNVSYYDRAQGVSLLLPVAVLHFAAFTMGYFLSKGLKFNEKTARTVSIETGIPDSIV